MPSVEPVGMVFITQKFWFFLLLSVALYLVLFGFAQGYELELELK